MPNIGPMRRLFGTDGIRGVAGEPPLDEATVSRVGFGLVHCLKARVDGKPPLVVLGGDTRESTADLAAALAGGIAAAGGRTAFAGVIPTPGVAFLVGDLGADAGIVVSASHNPWRDNGVKVFSRQGRKLPDELEAALETEIERSPASPPMALQADAALGERYVARLVSTLPHRLDGMTVVFDAANGAASAAGPEAFRRAGARVVPIAVLPDGRNINDGCGALHPEGMAEATKRECAALGIAVDGDADRIILADGDGRLLDGDDVLFLWTLELLREGRQPSCVVGTVMSNFALEKALAEKGVALRRAAVGDRYVVELMEKESALLGGEPSGHLIRSDLTTTGDGILTGLHLAAFVAASGKPLAAQPRLVKTPQVLRNVRVRERIPFDEIPDLAAACANAERRLGGEGRILLRYSGTEPLARVMVEGTDASLVSEIARDLEATLRTALGV